MTKTPASTPFYWTISPCRLYFIAHPLDSFLSRPGIRICCHSYFYAIVVDITYTRRLLLPGWYRKVFFRRSFFFSTCSQWNRILIEIKWDSVIFQTGRVGRGTSQQHLETGVASGRKGRIGEYERTDNGPSDRMVIQRQVASEVNLV